MNTSVIKVEKLSKKFIIGHQQKESYTALRDVMAHSAKRIFSAPFLRRESRTITTTEEFWALNDVSFEINRGDRLGIIGRNGAGKSTLLKILSRITEPTSGRIRIRGRVASLLEVGTGFHPELSGRENIFLNGAILGMSRREIRDKFDEIVAFAEVERFLDTPVKRYSSGMYVRLAFAVAAHLEPDILIVDEVLAVGDSQFQKKCLGKMEDVSKNEGRTVLFVSHNMGVIAQLCNKALLLNRGEIQASGSAEEVMNIYVNSGNATGNFYERNDTNSNLVNYFSKIFTSKTGHELTSDFLFDEEVQVNFEVTINEYSENLLVAIVLLDKYQKRVTTLIKNVGYFSRDGSKYIGKVTLPSSIIAPNSYSFLGVIWNSGGKIFDSIEAVCPIKVHDNGTVLAAYDGADNGNVILEANWQ
jgi:lipopolysaccharide transport system ATP-binding protein